MHHQLGGLKVNYSIVCCFAVVMRTCSQKIFWAILASPCIAPDNAPTIYCSATRSGSILPIYTHRTS